MGTFFKSLGAQLMSSATYQTDTNILDGKSFVNTSQTASTVAQTLMSKVKNTENFEFSRDNKDIAPIAGAHLNSTIHSYVRPIDFTEMGELPDSFLTTLAKYNKPMKDVHNTSSFFLDSNKKLQQVYSTTPVVPSLFNPYVGVKVVGMGENQPLLDYKINENNSSVIVPKVDTSNCSIWKLLRLSTKSNNEHNLGSSVYKLADFMYCKDLGKVSNNHLITLRRYKMPIGDNIYHRANTGDPDNLYSCSPDVAHLVTWFGTEDNKLSDIVKLSFHASWREMNAEIQEVDSQADSEGTGVFGMIANTLNPAYNKSMGRGISGNHNLISPFMSHFNIGPVNFGKPGQYQNHEVLRNYDKHKIYEPKNTIQSNHYYEGKILFEHEFTLKFCYKLRSYNNINQRSAMVDLINNILLTTFTKGSFWGGDVKMIGAPGNNSQIKKMNAFVDNTWDKLAGFAESVLTGAVNWQELLGSLSDAANKMLNAAGDEAKKFLGDPSGTAKSYGQKVVDFWKSHDFSSAVKGALKNGLGRPALYAINSFVSGENLGLWHVTIGNPLNPIMTIGNLILTNATLEFGDCPLGLDDFPTELICNVTLKHCKPRDLTAISQMFTKGESAIALPLGQTGWSNFWTPSEAPTLHDSQGNETTKLTKDNYNEYSIQQIYGTSHIAAISQNHAELTTK